MCLLPFVAFALWSRRKTGAAFFGLVSWFCVALVCLLLQGKFYPYHWLPVYPPAVALAVLGFRDWFALGSVFAKAAAIGVAGAFAVLAPRTAATETILTAQYLAGAISHPDYYGHFHIAYRASDALHAVNYLRHNAKEGDRLFIFGHEATVGYLAKLTPATRFTFSLPLAAPGPFLARYRCEAMRDLEANPPQFVLLGAPYESEKTDDKQEFVCSFPEFEQLLLANYDFDQNLRVSLHLYKRKAGAAQF